LWELRAIFGIRSVRPQFCSILKPVWKSKREIPKTYFVERKFGRDLFWVLNRVRAIQEAPSACSMPPIWTWQCQGCKPMVFPHKRGTSSAEKRAGSVGGGGISSGATRGGKSFNECRGSRGSLLRCAGNRSNCLPPWRRSPSGRTVGSASPVPRSYGAAPTVQGIARGSAS
jgi:hypothetical protein